MLVLVDLTFGGVDLLGAVPVASRTGCGRVGQPQGVQGTEVGDDILPGVTYRFAQLWGTLW